MEWIRILFNTDKYPYCEFWCLIPPSLSHLTAESFEINVYFNDCCYYLQHWNGTDMYTFIRPNSTGKGRSKISGKEALYILTHPEEIVMEELL